MRECQHLEGRGWKDINLVDHPNSEPLNLYHKFNGFKTHYFLHFNLTVSKIRMSTKFEPVAIHGWLVSVSASD